MEEKFDAFEKKFDAFVLKYETDMRGDKDLSNGNRGVINILRDIIAFPSLFWLLAHRPGPTIAAIVVSHAVLEILQEIGGKGYAFVLKYLGM